MRHIFLLLLTLILFQTSFNAQIPYGGSCPNFNLDDLDGVNHELYDYLDQGYGAILDFSATWCPPCWNYHQTGILEDVWLAYGPPGSDDAMVFFIEPDPTTSQQCIYGSSGCSGGSIGNWTTGVDYPILNPSSSGASQVNNDFDISYFPTIYAVGPNYKIYETSQLSFNGWSNWIESFKLEATHNFSGNTSCAGQGDIELFVSGGYGSLSFQWSNGATTQNLYNVTPGTYSATISDNHGYDIEVGPIIVGGEDPIELYLDNIQHVDCSGEDNGAIDIVAEGGSGQYSYVWGNGDVGSSIDNLDGGVYFVTVTDDNTGCTDESWYEVNEPQALWFSYSTTMANCNATNGGVTLNTSGGAAPYQFSLNNMQSNSPSFSGLDTGAYTLLVEDFNGCTYSESITIEQVFVPVADTITTLPLNCYNESVQINADSSSIGASIGYIWLQDTVVVDTGYAVNLENTGDFLLVVIDSISTCTDTLMFQVASDTEIAEATILTSSNTLTCIQESIELQSNIEDPNLTQTWTFESDLLSSESGITINQEGQYILSVLDTLNGCSSSDTISISAEQTIPDIGLIELVDISCTIDEGSIVVESSDELSYQWSTQNGIIISGESSAAISVGTTGDYEVLVTDVQTGCIQSFSYEVTASTELPEVVLNQPQILSCNNSLSSISTTDSEDYSYAWIDSDGNSIPNANSSSLIVNSPGEYLVEVTNLINGCSQTGVVEVIADFEEPDVSILELTAIDCNSESGGIALTNEENFTYEWYDSSGNLIVDAGQSDFNTTIAGNYSVIITNQMNGCSTQLNTAIEENIQEPPVEISGNLTLDCTQTETEISTIEDLNYRYDWFKDGEEFSEGIAQLVVLEAGNYTVHVTDIRNGCTSSKEFVVGENFTLPQVELLLIDDARCDNLYQTFIEVSYDPNYEYLWTSGNGEIIDFTDNRVEVRDAGDYDLFITDLSNGCQSSATYTVEYSVPPPTLTITGNTEICQGATATLCAETNGSDIHWYENATIFSTDACVDLINPGVIEVAVLNAIGCQSNETINLTAFNYPLVNLESNGILDCNTPEVLLNSMIDDNISVEYTWIGPDNLDISNESSILANLPGLYELQLYYPETGCEDLHTIEVDIDPTATPLSAFSTQKDEMSFVFTNQTIEAVDGYSWEFGDGQVSNDPNPEVTYSTPGYYNVCLTTFNKCGENTQCVEVLAAEELTYNVNPTHILCHGDLTGGFNLDLEGGLPEYSIEWTSPDGSKIEEQNPQNLAAGVYTLNVVDNGEGMIEQTFEINQPDEMLAVPTIVQPTEGFANGSIAINVNGGTSPYEYLWNTGDSLTYLQNLASGVYTVTIIDSNDCVLESSFELEGIISSSKDESLEKHFYVFPNPTSALLYFNISKQAEYQVQLIDKMGRILMTNSFNNQSNATISLDLSAIPDGLYLLRLQSDEDIYVETVLMAR